MHTITVSYTIRSGNFAVVAAAPVVTELVFPSNAQVLTVAVRAATRPSRVCRAVAQADESNVATSHHLLRTANHVTLEATLDVYRHEPRRIEGPSVRPDAGGRLQPVAFPSSQRGTEAGVLLQGVSVGTQSPGAVYGDVAVAGVLDVLQDRLRERRVGIERPPVGARWTWAGKQ